MFCGETFQNENEENMFLQTDRTSMSENWGYVMCQVIDSGQGIEPSVVKKLFKTFSQFDVSVFKSQGVGIGLSTAKQLCQAMGGAIMLESAPQIGTNVTFAFQVRENSKQMT